MLSWNIFNPFNLFRKETKCNTEWYADFIHSKRSEKPMYFTNSQRQQLQSYLASLITTLDHSKDSSLHLAKFHNVRSKECPEGEIKELMKTFSRKEYSQADKINKKIKNLAKLQSVIKNLYTEGPV